MSNHQGTGTPPATGLAPENVPVAGAPASLQQAKMLWLVAVVIEVIHQALSVVMTFLNKDQAVSQVKDSLPAGQDYTDQMINASVIAAAIGALVITLLILGVVVYFVLRLAQAGKKAITAQKVLTYFAVYFVLRAFLLFLASPTSDLPIALYATDGVLQIIVAALAAVAAVIAMNKESADWLDKQVAP